MSDVVGTAYVRIKALTDKLAKDIEKGISKSMKDADLEKAAKDKGDETGKDFADSTADATKKTLDKRSKDMVPGDAIAEQFRGVVKNARKEFEQLNFEDAINGIEERFDQLELQFPEVDDIDIDVNIDTDRALNSFELLQARLGESLQLPDIDDIEIDVDVDTSRAENAFDVIQRRFDEIRSRAENQKGTPLKFFDLDADANFRKSLELDSDAMRRMGEQFREARELMGDGFDMPSFDLPFDEGRMSNFFRRFKSGLDDTNADTQNWAGKMRTHFNNLGNDVRRGPLDKALDGVAAKLRNLGTVGLPSIGRMGTMLGLIGGAIVAALPYIQDVGAAVLAYATGLVAQVGALATSLVGVGAAAGAALGATALAALPIILAFKAETELLVEFKDSMGAAGEEFLRIGVATQQTLLPALDEAVFVMGDLVPMFSEFGLFVGQSVGNFAKLAANTLTGATAQGRFAEIMRSSLSILDMLGPILLNVGDILSGIWVAALPAAERFVETIGNLVERWSDMVNEGLRSGELTRTINTWYDRAELLGSALGDVAGGLFDILEVGATSAGGLFERFDAWAENFREFTSSEVGQNRLALIFDNALAVMREVNGIAADLFDGIFGRLGDVGGVDTMVAALQRFRDVIPEIQEFWGNAYTTIKEVVNLFADSIWEKISIAWDQMADPLGRLATQFLELLDVMNQSGAFEVFLDLMEILTNVLASLLDIPGFGQFVAYTLAFGGAIKIASIALGPFLHVFGGFSSVLLNLIRMKAGMQMAGMAGSIGKFAAGLRAVSAAKTAGTAIEGVGAAMKIGAGSAGSLAGGLGGAVSQLGILGPIGLAAGAAIGVAGYAFFSASQDSQQFKQDVREATDALGLLNDGLNITAEGIATYIGESSRFEGNDQIDDLERMAFSVAGLGDAVAKGTLTYEEFANRTLSSGETFVTANGHLQEHGTNLQDLQKEYGLTDDEVRRLAKGEDVWVDGTKLAIEGNDSLIESFKELNEVLGQAAKDNVGAFATNAQNIRLLGEGYLNDLVKDVNDAEKDDAAPIMAAGQDALAEAATKSAAAIVGLSDATRAQIREQATMADGTIDVVKQEQLLTDALSRQSAQIRADLELFANIEVGGPFESARAAAVQFSLAVNDVDFAAFQRLANGGDLDALLDKFPDLANETDNLFRQLEHMPAEEFNAFATSLNIDAESLRTAMDGAKEAIAQLAEAAVSTLPTVGQLLDDATSTDENGEEQFDREGFVKGITDRTRDTQQFATNIGRIKENIGEEAARLAATEGPKAAQDLVDMIGHGEEGLETALQAMRDSEQALKTQIETVFGPGIRLQYLAMAEPLSEGFGIGLANGINSEASLEALRGSSIDALNYLARGFQGHFVVDGNAIKFIHTGIFARTSVRYQRPTRTDPALRYATGGFVDKYGIANTFHKSFGTDTVPAMLTPGEYVINRQDVARLGVDFYDTLNRGGTPVAPVPVAAGGSPITANGWTIVAPSPEESARQMVSRFRTLSFLLGGS